MNRLTTSIKSLLNAAPRATLIRWTYTLIALQLLQFYPSQSHAEILDIDANYLLGLQIGDNSNSNTPNRVIFEVPGVPLAENTNAPVDSINTITGGSSSYTVRFELDSLAPPEGTARLTANSGQAISCTTPTTYGSTSVSMSTISWQARDNDNMEVSSSFNGSSGQLMHEQTVTDAGNGGGGGNGMGMGGGNGMENGMGGNNNPTGIRHRDYVRFTYSNQELLPAGTYRGRVQFTATFP
jgi:hypothetical protein